MNYKNKNYAIVFDYSKTLADIKRVIKVAKTNEFICNMQTIDIVDDKIGRVLVIIIRTEKYYYLKDLLSICIVS